MVQRRDYRRGYRRRKKSFFGNLSLNTALIILNVVIFVVLFPILAFVDADLILRYVALNPSLFIEGFVWTLLTSMFMHGGFAHLFVNMISLFFVGSFVERLIGRKRFVWFYLVSGLVAGLFFIVLAYLGLFIPGGERLFGGVDAFAVGASGAIFGLAGLLAVLVPRLKVLVMFIIPMPLWLGVVALLFGFWAISIASGFPIGNTAHFGGLVVGLIYGFYLRKKYSKKVRMLNRMLV